MAWVNWANIEFVILKNGAELETGQYTAFKVTTNIATRIANMITDGSTVLSTVSGYASNPPSSAYESWAFAASELASMSTILQSAGWDQILTSNGDYLTFYNPQVGPRYAFHIRRYSAMWYEIGVTRAGTTSWETNRILNGVSGNFYNGSALGFLVDGFTCYPFVMYYSRRISNNETGGDVRPFCFYTKSTFNTAKYDYYFMVSDAWQPPTPPPPPASDEPYGDDTYTASVGGDGDHDDTSDTISQDAIPIAAATRSGMCTAWVPNWGEIQDVADALLDPNIFQILSGNVVKFSDVIIGLSIFPCAIPATDTDTVKANVLGVEIGTGVQAHIADDQFVSIDCGTLDVTEYWGNCLDYNPYTRISIFLPFCGMYELDVDEVMGKTIGVSYRIDIMSGSCLATIKINDSVFYQYPGQCSAQVPLSSVSFDQFLGSMIELGVATATSVGAVGAAGGAVSAVRDQMFVPQSRADLRSHTEEIASAEQNYSKVKEQSANSIADAAVGAVMGAKGFYQHAGAMSGSPGFLGIKKPYLIIKRPEQLIPGMYGKFHGFPSNTTAVLGDLVGYTEVGDIRLNIPEATVDEIIECEQLLKGGVVI